MYKFVYTLYIQKWNFVAESSAVGWYGFLTGIYKFIFEKNLLQGDIMKSYIYGYYYNLSSWVCKNVLE